MTDLASQVTDNNCHVTRLFAVQWLSLRNDRRAHSRHQLNEPDRSSHVGGGDRQCLCQIDWNPTSRSFGNLHSYGQRISQPSTLPSGGPIDPRAQAA
jgi:hypothetical protein